ncbi:MAG: DUF370 domain-containing protein [Clostridia bacterium]|nr:DUF370 domain-containing protein [Clostridia bacterium]MBQ5648582.1 DUF370 domain-containing protein [Clostridia bacterium]MBQ5809264.1 DUF370 domain-containing protein [Clostridia bacterium]
MYLHAGNNKILRSSRIIGIFDLDTSSRGDDTKEYLRAAEKNGLAESAAEELPKSFILYEDEDGKTARVMFSQISTSALVSRINGEFK